MQYTQQAFWFLLENMVLLHLTYPESLNCNIANILNQMVVVGGLCHRRFGSIPGLCPLDVRTTNPTPTPQL